LPLLACLLVHVPLPRLARRLILTLLQMPTRQPILTLRPMVTCLLVLSSLLTLAAWSDAQEAAPARGDSLPLPTPEELRELVGYAEPVALEPHAVKLESFRGDTINGVYLVDSDLPSARHIAYGKDAQGFRYVWFSRKNPLRTSLVAIYQVDGAGAPDVLYWRQIDNAERIARAREFRSPAASGLSFQYSSGPPCGKARCDPGWRELPLARIAVPREFFQPLERLFDAAARVGEAHLDRPVSSLRLGPSSPS
jgi:hypothetical protein